jgi:DNA primase
MSNVPKFVDFRAVKSAVTMEQVLAHYGILDQFKRKDGSLSGPCPIHRGTNPTQFRVSLSKNCWNCFSDCKCGGNVLDFVAKKEGIEPVAAANRLVDWFHLDRETLNADAPESKSARADQPLRRDSPGVKPPASIAPAQPKPGEKPPPPKPPDKPEIGANKPLSFRLELDATHPYLAERGLTPETVQEFGLGLCQKGVMSDRIAIPIHNHENQLVGYVGRWPGKPPEQRPKYRMPDGFKKSAEIFNLARALAEPPERPLIITEGFFDVMKLWQLGCRKAVALMGSSMSATQEELIARTIRPGSQVIVMLDEDEAGRAGRAEIVQRLALRTFVRVVAFAQEGFQPEDLTAEELALLHLEVSP